MSKSKKFEFSINYHVSKSQIKELVEKACDTMIKIYQSGYYPKLKVNRPWSNSNPVIAGELAKPSAYQGYLYREIKKLAKKKAIITITPSRKRKPMNTREFFDSLDEDSLDFRKKKLFLFQPERIEISLNRLEHYTGTNPEDFQRIILLTNYAMYMNLFKSKFPDCVVPKSTGCQMPAFHHVKDDQKGISIINIGVGPANAKTATDHIAVLRPDAMIMVGHCGGLRNNQNIGDFVLASGYMRGDHILDETVPLNVPIIPNYYLNRSMQKALIESKQNYRLGIVYSAADRNWEFSRKKVFQEILESRSTGIDMESSVIATNGFRYRIPNATLLCVSDKPLHGQPKLKDTAKSFYKKSKENHLSIVLKAIEISRKTNPEGFPNSDIRDFYEPLFGGPEE
jgi:AMP nucleosidase